MYKKQNRNQMEILLQHLRQELPTVWSPLLIPKILGLLSPCKDQPCLWDLWVFSVWSPYLSSLPTVWNSELLLQLLNMNSSVDSGISQLYVLLTVPDKVPSSEVKSSSFPLMSLPVDEISWLMIIKRWLKEMFWKGALNPVVKELAVVQESVAIFCHVTMQ